jgi:Spy/CpxP family protein refolding chaperone
MQIVFSIVLLFASTVGGIDKQSLYSGQEKREIKALSVKEINGYLSGRGLGMAKTAELNHYPGPMHVLELADKLKLSEQQRKRTQAIFEQMKRQVLPLGKQLVEKERELDGLFASQNISENEMARLVGEIAALNGKLRAAHLRAHLAQKQVLTAEQVTQYDQLRGYGVSKHGDDDGVHKPTHWSLGD